jgi:hypothetical protein
LDLGNPLEAHPLQIGITIEKRILSKYDFTIGEFKSGRF